MLTVFEPQLTMNLHFGTARGSAPRRPLPKVYSVAGGTRRGANRSVEVRCTQPMEEPPIEAARLKLAHRAVIAIGQDGLRACRGIRDRPEAVGDFGESIVPGDRLESALALAANASKRREQPIGAVDALEVAGHFLAQETAREAVIGIAAKLDCHAVLDGDQHAAGVGAVEGADVLEDGQPGTTYCCRHGDSLRSNGAYHQLPVRPIPVGSGRVDHRKVSPTFSNTACPEGKLPG